MLDGVDDAYIFNGMKPYDETSVVHAACLGTLCSRDGGGTVPNTFWRACNVN